MAASDALVSAARAAREHAVADYSHFKVGAALETADGHVITGCNVENATYGLTICAERVAIFKALSDGHRTFTRIAIVARQMSMEVLGISCITNMAAGVLPELLHHDDVMATARRVHAQFTALLEGIIERI